MTHEDTAKKNLYVQVVHSSLTTDLVNAVDQALATGIKSLMILRCTANRLDFELLNNYLPSLSVPVFGGIFPAIIIEGQNYETGSVVCGFYLEAQTCPLSPLSEYDGSIANTLSEIAERYRAPGAVIAIGDGLSPFLDHLIGTLYNHLGADVIVSGGGAGRLDFISEPCVITNEGVLADAAQIVHLPLESGVGVHHGWEKISGPYLVTKATENIIQTLNYKPAFELYQKVVGSISNTKIGVENFLAISKRFPFGMEKLDDELVVRDPIKVEDNSLHCVGLVPEHTMLYILEGNDNKLIEAAGQAAKEALQQLQQHTPVCTLVFDCITRALFLENRFASELERVVASIGSDTPIVGALTLGEIASSSMGGIQFLNKTTVINVLGE